MKHIMIRKVKNYNYFKKITKKTQNFTPSIPIQHDRSIVFANDNYYWFTGVIVQYYIFLTLTATLNDVP